MLLKLPLFALVSLLTLSTNSFNSSIEDNFVKIKLPKGVSAELPKNWSVLSEKTLTTIDAAQQSISEKAGIFDASSVLNFGANYYMNGKAEALFNIRYYPELDIRQTEAAKFDKYAIQAIDSMLQVNVRLGEKDSISGYKVTKWLGTKMQNINNLTIFTTEYKRTGYINNSSFCVRLVRVFNASRSFTITVSYKDSQAPVLRPITDKIIRSIRQI